MRAKAECRMLMKLTQDVNFTKILQAALAQKRSPKVQTDIDDFFVFFAFGICVQKKLHIKFVKSTNLTNLLAEQMCWWKEFGSISLANNAAPNLTIKHN